MNQSGPIDKMHLRMALDYRTKVKYTFGLQISAFVWLLHAAKLISGILILKLIIQVILLIIISGHVWYRSGLWHGFLLNPHTNKIYTLALFSSAESQVRAPRSLKSWSWLAFFGLFVIVIANIFYHRDRDWTFLVIVIQKNIGSRDRDR